MVDWGDDGVGPDPNGVSVVEELLPYPDDSVIL